MREKSTGSFYTPKLLVEYMVQHSFKLNSPQRILEPSFGDGRFIQEYRGFCCAIKGIENDQTKVDDFCRIVQMNVNVECADFIEYAIKSDETYDLIIGNPPYISKKTLSDNDRQKSIDLTKILELPSSVFQNLWVSFVLAAVKLLNPENGAIYFVLPFEFLQVQYAEKLRGFLESKFNYIEITTFRDSVFPKIEQDVCLLYMTNFQNIDPIIKYTTVNSIDDMVPVYHSEICRNKPLKKWSNAILDDEETELLFELRQRYMKILELGDISPGIVTGANKYFIVSDDKVNELNCREFVIPILQYGASVGNLLEFDNANMKKLTEAGKAIWMLNLSGRSENCFPAKLIDYINIGQNEENKINERYKCKNRSRWYDVPMIKTGQLMFFKRYHRLPKLVVNMSGVFTTDISYNVRLKKTFDPCSVVFCFYNSLTLALCEYSGRFYSGGVGELVPSEFKSLVIPYKLISDSDINTMKTMLCDNVESDEIINFVDSIVFGDLSTEKILQLKKIRSKYLMRRIKKA